MTQKTEFTPGPWEVIIDDTGGQFTGRPSVEAAEELDCSIVHGEGFYQEFWRSARGDKEIHANARLIAAAPDMYAACEALIEAWQNATDDKTHQEVGSAFYLAGKMAEAALSKASGET